jgi:hypothetical protein
MAGPPEVQNGHKNLGPGEAEAEAWLLNPRGAGIGFVAGKNHDIGGTFSQLGGFVGFINPSYGKAYPKGDKAPSNPRGSRSVLAGTADASKPTTMVMKIPEGSGMTVVGGAEVKSTIQLATGDGKNGMMITEGYIALYTQNCYLVIDANRGVTFSNNFRVQEGPPDSPKAVNNKTYTKLAAAEPNQGGAGVMGSILPGVIGAGGAPGSSGSTGGSGWNNIKGGSPHVISPT